MRVYRGKTLSSTLFTEMETRARQRKDLFVFPSFKARNEQAGRRGARENTQNRKSERSGAPAARHESVPEI